MRSHIVELSPELYALYDKRDAILSDMQTPFFPDRIPSLSMDLNEVDKEIRAYKRRH